MFDWLRPKNKSTRNFPDNQSAFAHACGMRYQLLLEARIPALVIEEGRRGAEGEHWFLLHLAGPEGAQEIWGCTMAGAPALPEIGDLVAYQIVRIATELPPQAQLIGYIASRLDPVLVDGRLWRVAIDLSPPDLKPVLHM